MVSGGGGDTDISLHICPGPISNFSKCQDLPKLGRYSGQVKTKNTKICLILHGGGGGGKLGTKSQNRVNWDF